MNIRGIVQRIAQLLYKSFFFFFLFPFLLFYWALCAHCFWSCARGNMEMFEICNESEILSRSGISSSFDMFLDNTEFSMGFVAIYFYSLSFWV